MISNKFIFVYPFLILTQDDNSLILLSENSNEVTVKLFGYEESMAPPIKKPFAKVFSLKKQSLRDPITQHKWSKKKILHLTTARIIQKNRPAIEKKFDIDLLYSAILTAYTNNLSIQYSFGQNEIHFKSELNIESIIEIIGETLENDEIKPYTRRIKMLPQKVTIFSWGQNKNINAQLKIKKIKICNSNKEFDTDYTCFGTTTCSLNENKVEFKDGH